MLKSESAFFGLKIYAEIKRLKTFRVKQRNMQAPMDYRRLRNPIKKEDPQKLIFYG